MSLKKFYTFIIVSLIIASFILTDHLSAGYVVTNGRVINAKEVATLSAQGHFEAGSKAYEKHDWQEAANHFCIVSLNFRGSVYAQESYYFLGVSYYFLHEFEHANKAFTEYLKVQNNPRYFQSAIEFKFAIADNFNLGSKRRPLGSNQLPKWFCGQVLAITIYEEVVAAIPCHEMAAKALIMKGGLHWKLRQYPEAIESFQMVIRRFPKYEQTPDCYLHIEKVYLEQCQFEFQNSDLLTLAEITLRKFERDFPKEERLAIAAADVMAIKELYACGLYETGQYYERTKKNHAAIIYYNDAIKQFSDTCIAEKCRERMKILNPCYCEDLPEVEILNIGPIPVDVEKIEIEEPSETVE